MEGCRDLLNHLKARGWTSPPLTLGSGSKAAFFKALSLDILARAQTVYKFFLAGFPLSVHFPASPGTEVLPVATVPDQSCQSWTRGGLPITGGVQARDASNISQGLDSQLDVTLFK